MANKQGKGVKGNLGLAKDLPVPSEDMDLVIVVLYSFHNSIIYSYHNSIILDEKGSPKRAGLDVATRPRKKRGEEKQESEASVPAVRGGCGYPGGSTCPTWRQNHGGPKRAPETSLTASTRWSLEAGHRTHVDSSVKWTACSTKPPSPRGPDGRLHSLASHFEWVRQSSAWEGGCMK